jgi:hypothetical protein
VCCFFRWQEHLRKDPRNFETLEKIPGVMSDVLKEHVMLSNHYMRYMAKDICSLKEFYSSTY